MRGSLSDRPPCWPQAAFGHYHETYRKVGGQWRIVTLDLTRLRLDFTNSPTPRQEHP